MEIKTETLFYYNVMDKELDSKRYKTISFNIEKYPNEKYMDVITRSDPYFKNCLLLFKYQIFKLVKIY